MDIDTQCQCNHRESDEPKNVWQDSNRRGIPQKPYTGHTLAAAGSIEAVYCLMALQNGVIFPNLNFHQQMGELSITPQIELIRNTRLKNVLSNSFGFGGNSSSLVFSVT